MDKEMILEALIAVEDKLDFPPEKKLLRGKYYSLLTPETYEIIRQKYGHVNPFTEKEIDDKINSCIQNLRIKASYVVFENEAINREIELYKKQLRFKEFKIAQLSKMLEKK
jgi:hypothetical protein